MRDPLSPKFQKVQSLMKTGQMVGRDRPVGRITWAKGKLLEITSKKPGVGTLHYLDKSAAEHEIFTVRTIDISRSIGQDAATCTIVLYNARGNSTQPEGLDTSGTAGYMTPGRGETRPVTTSIYTTVSATHDLFGSTDITYPTDWLYATNPYRDVFIPNTVIRTYQGYGSDNFDTAGNMLDQTDANYVPPEQDAQLYNTGVWLIDKVTINTDGTMTLECRDLAKLLIEQYIYPPMIPIERFPLIYAPAHEATGHKESIGKNVAKFHSSSVDAAYGKNASIAGHRGTHAFDGNASTFWLSGPDNTGGDLEWIQASVHGDINEIVLNTWGGDYIAFICIHENGKWQGPSANKVSGRVETAVKKNTDNLNTSETGTGGFFYVITKGDTLWDLAGKFYGDNFKWPIIAKANSNIINDPHWIYPGQKIKIPYVDGTNAPSSGSSAGGGGAHSNYPTTYTVVKGDTLWGIAGYYYNDNSKWPKIYDANKDKIKDPHWIYPGQKFHIPYIPGTPFSPPKQSVPPSPGGSGGQGVEITYVQLVTIPKSGKVTVTLDRTYKADYVRVVFTNLYQSSSGAAYRAGVREMVVRNHIANTYVASTIGKAGYIQDWTEPIKEMCAWAGLTWPNATPNPADPVLGMSATNADKTALQMKIAKLKSDIASTQKAINSQPTTTDKDKQKLASLQTHLADLQDQLLVDQTDLQNMATTPDSMPLRVWGDFEILGAGPVVATPGDYFMSKSFMDGIGLIRDFIGAIFYIDESGGTQFRLPNIWSGGNFLNDTAAASSLGARFSEHPIEFHEDANLVEYEMTISDEDLRSEILVIGGYPSVNASGPVAGGYVLGTDPSTGTTSAIDFTNVLAGQYRMMIVPGDSTKLFYTEAECQRMAELTALMILFTYRQGQLTAPCHPGLQIDDQVRIYERISAETYIHYVSSIDTHMDLESGEFTMKAQTHWLGNDPDTDWFINKQQLTPAVLELPAILKRVGKQAGGDTFEQPPYGT